jgi:hypothetical protein
MSAGALVIVDIRGQLYILIILAHDRRKIVRTAGNAG